MLPITNQCAAREVASRFTSMACLPVTVTLIDALGATARSRQGETDRQTGAASIGAAQSPVAQPAAADPTRPGPCGTESSCSRPHGIHAGEKNPKAPGLRQCGRVADRHDGSVLVRAGDPLCGRVVEGGGSHPHENAQRQGQDGERREGAGNGFDYRTASTGMLAPAAANAPERTSHVGVNVRAGSPLPRRSAAGSRGRRGRPARERPYCAREIRAVG